ncbi:MAG: hypothetical protein IKT40_12170 [Bacilli bacterium]|nr:hypothetical protein [Bacilli bacterium]
MKRFKDGKTYISTDDYVRLFNDAYGDKVGKITPNMLHFLFNYYGVPKEEKNGIKYYKERVVNQIRGREHFMQTMKDIVDHLDRLNITKDINKDNKSYVPSEYSNEKPILGSNDDNSDMIDASNELENNYQTESKKLIRISEDSYKRLFEGATFTPNDDNTINLSIDSKQDDLSNKSVDTRIFGNKQNILYGDNTLSKHNKNLNDRCQQLYQSLIDYQTIINYAENSFNGDLSSIRQVLVDKIKPFVENGDAEGLINWAKSAYDRNYQLLSNYMNKKIRVSGEDDNNQRIARYNKIRVQGTNVYAIALFTMDGFELSDAIKHGTLRQNQNTDKMLGLDKSDRKNVQGLGKGKNKSLEKLNVTYDDKFNYDIKNNFSYAGDKDHYKTSYQSKDDYSSVNQFLDKSIMYANYALKKENFIPDYIVSAPSSSEFNKYYCINLSRKIGVPYIENFFKRNLINVVLDEEQMLNDGVNVQDIMWIKSEVLKAVYGEVASYAKVPIDNFFNNYRNVLTTISADKHSREKIDENVIKDALYIYIYNALSNKQDGNSKNVYKVLLNKMINNKIDFVKSKTFNTNHIISEIMKRVQFNIGKKVFLNVIEQVDMILKEYENKIGKGFNINMNKFKIVKLEKRFRKYLNNVYVISDENLNNDKELFSRYQNSKFLIFDEDINSGATLKLVIDALQDKLQNSQQNIMCLVNAFSENGR